MPASFRHTVTHQLSIGISEKRRRAYLALPLPARHTGAGDAPALPACIFTIRVLLPSAAFLYRRAAARCCVRVHGCAPTVVEGAGHSARSARVNQHQRPERRACRSSGHGTGSSTWLAGIQSRGRSRSQLLGMHLGGMPVQESSAAAFCRGLIGRACLGYPAGCGFSGYRLQSTVGFIMRLRSLGCLDV